ncbi:MAG: heavy metal translocating P-type ATPase, partial [Planctomycetota bacterium]
MAFASTRAWLLADDRVVLGINSGMTLADRLNVVQPSPPAATVSPEADVARSDASAALAVDGMTCMGCVASVTKLVGELPGVQAVDVNLPRGRASLGYDPSVTNPTAVAAAISAAGFPSSVQTGDAPSTQAAAEAQRDVVRYKHAAKWRRRAVVGLVIWAPLELLHWTLYVLDHRHDGLGVMAWLGVAVGTLIALYTGRAFVASALEAAQRRTTNMDTLVALGGGTAFAYSSVALLGHLVLGWPLATLYFMEAAGLFTLISLGHWIEAAARDRTGSAIRALLDLSPPTALKIDGEREIEISACDLHPGDRVRIKPASRVPTDGVVENGRGAVDESMLTGEPLPVAKDVGDEVIGGTVNTDGSLVVRVTKAGADSTLAGIIKLVEQAQTSKPPVQKLADKISAIFVPTVLVIALGTAAAWLTIGFASDASAARVWGHAAKATCSVLIIACPCALGLAVPAAL